MKSLILKSIHPTVLSPLFLSHLFKFYQSFSTQKPSPIPEETLEEKKARASREALEQFHRIDSSFNLRDGGRDISADEDNIEFIEYSPRVKLLLRICSACFWSSVGFIGYNYYLVRTKRQKELGGVERVQQLAVEIERRGKGVYDFFTKPPLRRLLPKFPEIAGFVAPKTLVVSLEGTLVSSDYVLGKGMILNIRPGVIELLKKMSKKYEIVIYSNEDAGFIDMCVQHLDKQRQFFTAAFGKEATVFSYEGSYIDLEYFGRELQRIVVLVSDEHMARKQKGNVIVVGKFEGNEGDREIAEVGNLLQWLAKEEVKDVRQELGKFGDGKERVKKFREAVREQKERLQKGRGIGNFMSGVAQQQKQRIQQAAVLK